MAQSPILAPVTHSSLFNCGLSSPSQDSRWNATCASSKPNCHHLPKNQVLQKPPFSSFCSYSVHLPVKSVLSIFSAEAACPLLPLSTPGIVTRSTFLFIFTVSPSQHTLHCLYVCGMCTPMCIHVSECSCRYMHMRACVQARVQARVSLLTCDL